MKPQLRMAGILREVIKNYETVINELEKPNDADFDLDLAFKGHEGIYIELAHYELYASMLLEHFQNQNKENN